MGANYGPGALHRLQIRVLDHQPLRALLLEAHLYAGMRTVTFQVEDHAFAEFSVAHARPQADAAHGGFFRSEALARRRTRDLDARPDLLDQLGGELLHESRFLAVTVDAVQAA